MSRERERLLEENRKLRLEKASLENLRRVEQIATRDLGLQAAGRRAVVVVSRAADAGGHQPAQARGAPATSAAPAESAN